MFRSSSDSCTDTFYFVTVFRKGEEGSPTTSPSEDPSKAGKDTGLLEESVWYSKINDGNIAIMGKFSKHEYSVKCYCNTIVATQDQLLIGEICVYNPKNNFLYYRCFLYQPWRIDLIVNVLLSLPSMQLPVFMCGPHGDADGALCRAEGRVRGLWEWGKTKPSRQAHSGQPESVPQGCDSDRHTEEVRELQCLEAETFL